MQFRFSKSRWLIGFLPLVVFAALDNNAAKIKSGTWTPLQNQPSFAAAHVLLLTDGTVICQELETSNWHRLRPDKHGSYVNGTWEQIASLPSGYAPLYYASAVLADGRVVIAGGEFNFAGTGATNLAAIYNPKRNVWSPFSGPPGWANIADAQSVVLPDKRWMLANAFTSESAALDPKTLEWTILSPNGKADLNDEEGWNLLPDGTVLAVDIGNFPNSERYFPSMNMWMSAGTTGVSLTDFTSLEIGPAVLRPDGTIFQVGVCRLDSNGLCTTPAHTAIFDPPKDVNGLGAWTVGPDLPDGLDVSDGPASILPDGNVLIMSSPGSTQPGAVFLEFDGKKIEQVASPANAQQMIAYFGNMLVLPTGQILLTAFSNDVEIYTPRGKARPSWAPSIEDAPLLVNPGATYKISGTKFNGLSTGASYGDDAQMNTNYPLVRFTSLGSKHVSYWRTHDHSTMAVSTGHRKVATQFDVPDDSEAGPGFLSVVANGIPSEPRFVVVLPNKGRN